jgi:glycosyltransferase involved in cell wall biosynthesis
LKVLHVINSMNPGGAEYLLLRQLEAGRDLWDSAIVCIDEPGALADAARAANIDVASIGNGSRLNLRIISLLRAEVRRRAPDILHLHLPRSGIVGRMAFRARSPVPIVYTEHNLFEMYSPPIRLLNAATYAANDLTIAVSEGVRRSILAHVRPSRLRRQPVLVPNGVDVDALERSAVSRDAARAVLDLPTDAMVVGTIGNLFGRKGQRYLVDAFAALAKDRHDLHLVIIGSGPEEAHLIAQATHANVADRVSIVSGRPDAARYIRAFDVFALSSVFEGLPVALLEAMGLGVPSVGTNVGGIPELIQHEKTGLLVEPRDAAALSAVLRRLLDDAQLRGALAAAGVQHVRTNFSMSEMVRRTDTCYRALLSERASL